MSAVRAGSPPDAHAAPLERLALPAALGAVVAALAFVSGGFFSDAWVWGAVALCWVGAVALIFGAGVEPARAELVRVAAFALLAAWIAASALWSVDAGQSVLEARRALVYVAAAAVVALAVRRAEGEALLVAVWAAGALVAVYALARYLLGPARDRLADVAEGTLLFRPVGYANGLGVLAAIGIVLGAGIAVAGRRVELRLAAAASLVPLATALALTESRGAVVALAAGIAAALLLDERRREVARLAPAALAAAVGAVVAARSGLTDPPATLDPRIDARLVAAAVLVLSGLAAAATLVLDRRAFALRARLPRAAAAIAVAVAVAGAVAAVSRVGDSGNRPQYARVAWREYMSNPVLGSGAGTFGRYWARIGPADAGGARDAHDLYLETLAEVGPPGLVLLSAALGAPLVVVRAARRRRLAATAAAAYVVFLVHAALDWDWELPAVTLSALLCGGSLLVLARRDDAADVLRPRLRQVAAGALVLLAGLALAGLASGGGPR